MPRPLKESYGEEKPPFSYITLTAMAVWSSPQKMLPLSEIYKYITDKYPFYRKNTKKWQNSLRHNLSFNDCFIKIPRTFDKSAKGSYWALHPKAHHMFENGSLLRRRRRFRVDRSEKNVLNEELAALMNFQRFLLSQQKNQTDHRYHLQQQQQRQHQQQLQTNLHHGLTWENSFENLQPLSLISKVVPTLLSPSAIRPKRDFTIESLIRPDEPSKSPSLQSSIASSSSSESPRSTDEDLCSSDLNTLPSFFYSPKLEIPSVNVYNGQLHSAQYSTLNQYLQYQQHLQHQQLFQNQHLINHQLPHYINITAV